MIWFGIWDSYTNLWTCPTHLKEQACKQLVFPILKYCAPLWDPHLTIEVNVLESLQRRTARFVLNKPWIHSNTDSVTEMLSNLKWLTLQNHRKYLRLILLPVFKVHLQTIPEHYLPSLTWLSSMQSNHPCKFSHIQSSSDTYKFSFFLRTIPEWNNLKISNIINLSLDDLKHALNQWM